MLKSSAFAAMCLASVMTIAGAPVAQAKETCNFADEKEKWLGANDAFYEASSALDSLQDEKKFPPAKAFSYDEKKQMELQEQANTLVRNAREAFDGLVNSIIRNQSEACVVCGLVEDYNTAKSAGEKDATIAELSDPAVKEALATVVTLNVSLAAFQKDYDTKYAKDKTGAATTKAKTALASTKALIAQNLQALTDFRDAHKSDPLPSPMMKDKVSKFECTD